jgi:predicted permease
MGLIAVFSKLFPIVLYFFLGYLSKNLNIFDKTASNHFVRFIVLFAFPALVIYNVYNLEFNTDFIYLILTGWIVIILSIGVSFFIGKYLLRLNRKMLASFVLLSSFGNTSFLGFPFQLALLGEDGLKFAVVFDQLASFLPVSLLSPFLLAYGKGDKLGKINIRKIITFPPFVALIFSFGIKFLNIQIPQFVLDSLKMLGGTVIPLALFSIGINFKLFYFWQKKRELAFILALKMILIPILFLYFLTGLLNYPTTIEFKAFLIEISMPPMVLVSIFIIEQKLDEELAIAAVSTGIILSFLTVPFIYFLIS